MFADRLHRARLAISLLVVLCAAVEPSWAFDFQSGSPAGAADKANAPAAGISASGAAGNAIQAAPGQASQPPMAPLPAVPRSAPQQALPPTSNLLPPNLTAPQSAAPADFALEGATRSLGGAGAPASSTPYMIGDFFSTAGQIVVQGGETEKPTLVGTIPNAGGTQRVKISDNNSPIPRDRVFFAYNRFNDASLSVVNNQQNPLDVDRYTPGFEKTFFSGMASVELRTPAAYAQNYHVDLQGNGPPRMGQFGNTSLALKFLLWRSERLAVAAGTGINLPTAPDTLILQTGQPTLTLRNQSVHMMPYVGAFWAPTDQFYVQSFVQFDIDTHGDGVNVQNTGTVGVLNEQTFLYADVAMGYWVYQDLESRWITGVIPILEFHYNTTLQNADFVTAPLNNQSITLGNTFNRLDITNVTTGSHFRIGPLSFLTFAGAFPLKTRQSDRQFDSELIVQFNRLF